MYDIGPVHGLVNNAGVAVIESFFDVTKNCWNKYYLSFLSYGYYNICMAIIVLYII